MILQAKAEKTANPFQNIAGRPGLAGPDSGAAGPDEARTESRHVETLVSVLCKRDQTPNRSLSDTTCLVLDFTFKLPGAQ